jgi:hypothetical protein
MVSGVLVIKGTGVNGSDSVGVTVFVGVFSGTGVVVWAGEVNEGVLVSGTVVPWQPDNKKMQKTGRRRIPMGFMAAG